MITVLHTCLLQETHFQDITLLCRNDLCLQIAPTLCLTNALRPWIYICDSGVTLKNCGERQFPHNVSECPYLMLLTTPQCTIGYQENIIQGTSDIIEPKHPSLILSYSFSFTSLVPSDTVKENWSACFSSSLVCTYWTLRDARSAWVKVLILVPGERRRAVVSGVGTISTKLIYVLFL